MTRKIFKVNYRTAVGHSHDVNVLAKDAAQAISHVERYGKKKHYGAIEITGLARLLSIDVEYKS